METNLSHMIPSNVSVRLSCIGDASATMAENRPRTLSSVLYLNSTKEDSEGRDVAYGEIHRFSFFPFMKFLLNLLYIQSCVKVSDPLLILCLFVKKKKTK